MATRAIHIASGVDVLCSDQMSELQSRLPIQGESAAQVSIRVSGEYDDDLNQIASGNVPASQR